MVETPPKPALVQWILDTREWYPEVTETQKLKIHAARAFALLTLKEQQSVLRYVQLSDAKMSLASALLKRYAISRLTGVPWPKVVISRDKYNKPFYEDPATKTQPVSFNVSHQAGIVALVAVANPAPAPPPPPPPPGAADGGGGKQQEHEQDQALPQSPLPAEVGVDVVCTSERRDRDQSWITKDGWLAFVDMHGDALGTQEVIYLKHRLLGEVASRVLTASAEEIKDAMLRMFYARWALREAYIKMTGEALLAGWLRQLEFPNVRPPKPTAGWESADDERGEVATGLEVWFQGERVEDVNVGLRSMGEDYMIATMVRTPGRVEEGLGWTLGPYEVLSLEEVLRFAEASG